MKKDGTLYKHQTPEDLRCESRTAAETSNSEPSVVVNNSEEAELVLTLEQLENTSASEDETAVTKKDRDTPEEPVFQYIIRVHNTVCPVKSKSWRNENESLVRVKAEKTGKSITGSVRLVEESTEGPMTTLVYEVPVK